MEKDVKIRRGLLWLAGGVIITWLTYSWAEDGGGYIITWGAILYGIILLISGLASKE